jgi:Tol biopolymer transport system component
MAHLGLFRRPANPALRSPRARLLAAARRASFAPLLSASALFAQEAPTGAPGAPSAEEAAQLQAIKGTVEGYIVWSSSRASSRHDLWLMNADGTDPRPLTSGDAVDWFPRISHDGRIVLFNRSKGGWVPETDAQFPEKWDLWTIDLATRQETKVAENATWGTWRPSGQQIVFSRGAQVFQRDLAPLASGTETLLLDGAAKLKPGVIAQEPNLSPDGKLLALTLRGSMRETGIWDLGAGSWATTGDGCQIDWYPDGKQIYRMNPTGNGGSAAPSEVLRMTIENGKPVEKLGFFGLPKQVRLMDLPGQRSHEYFPKIDPTGSWLVWASTSKGHDHDMVDYELYLWKLGTPANAATRLTFHTGNDRWPDLHLGKLPSADAKSTSEPVSANLPAAAPAAAPETPSVP